MIHPKLIKSFSLLCTVAALSLANICQALPDDRNQPLHISSDTAEIDDTSGRSIYRGKVYMRQGSIKLWADQVTIINDTQGISKLVAIGVPAHFQQLPEANKTIMHAFGNTIEYFVADERIELKKQAKLEQEQNIFTGERIDYDIKHRIVNAYADKSSNQSSDKPRVNLIIQPTKTNTTTDDSSTNE